MVRCADIAEKLVDYADGALAPHEAVAVEAHLQVCAACSAEVEDLRRVAELVHGLEPVAVPHAFRLAVRQRIRALPPPRPLPLWRRLGLVGLGVPATLAAGLVGFAVFTLTAAHGVALPPSSTPGAVAGAPLAVSPTNPAPQPGPDITSPSPVPSVNPGGADSPPVTPPAVTPPPTAGGGGGTPDSGKGSSNPPPAVTGTPKPPVSLPSTAGGKLTANVGQVPTAMVAPPAKPAAKYYVYAADEKVAVADPKATAKSIQTWLQSVGGEVTASASDGLTLSIRVPVNQWYNAISEVKRQGTVLSSQNEEPLDATDAYNRDYADYQRAKASEQESLSQLQKTTDAGIKAQLQQSLDVVHENRQNLEDSLGRLEYANHNGIINLTLVAASATSDTYTTAPVSQHG